MIDLSIDINRDSLEWLEMMADYGPQDCRSMMLKIHAEITILRASHETAKELVKCLREARGDDEQDWPDENVDWDWRNGMDCWGKT